MTEVRLSQVYNNYENLKHFLIISIDNLLLEKLKTRFQLSRRKIDFISNVTNLITTLEKFGEFDAFNIEPMITIYGTITEGSMKNELGNFIREHKILIKKCDNVIIPVRNHYAEEILKTRSKSERNNFTNSSAIKENDCRRISNFKSKPEVFSKVEENHFNDNIKGSNIISDQYSKVIELISSEIGVKWRDLARNLGMKETEIEEIINDPSYRYLGEKSRRSLYILLQRKDPCTLKAVLVQALSKTRRNDLRKRVESML